MTDVLLTSEAFVKSATNISDNLAGKYMLSAMREAQEQGLRGILGDALTDKVKDLVKSKQISTPDNVAYKNLLDHCQYYLAYRTVVEVCYKVTYKIANFGVGKTTDEGLQVATQDETAKMQVYYLSKADAYCLDLQHFLLDNRDKYPELSVNDCHAIESNLYSAASCGIFLGGARGRRLKK